MAFHLRNGDATHPPCAPPWIIAHVCNDIGKWGRGFVVPLGERWPAAKQEYLADARDGRLVLGRTTFVDLGDGRLVANMVAQHGIMRAGRKDPPLRLDALAACLEQVNTRALVTRASIHMPRIGTGLAGGKWSDIEPLIQTWLDLEALEVYVYDFSR